MAEPPSAEVIRSFGGDPATVQSLDGGGGTSWRAAGVVLKPAASEREVAWIAAFIDALQVEGRLRVATFLPADSGDFVRDGWAATQWLDGQHRPDRWEETLAAGRELHESARAAGPEWPPFMQERMDAWSRATRAAWGEEPLPALPPSAAEMVDAAVRLLPAGAGDPAQVVHADLAGNVLFADESDLPPAIIDMSPQFRPATYAEAILVADAVA